MLIELIDNKIDEIINTYANCLNADVYISDFEKGRLQKIKSALKDFIVNCMVLPQESTSKNTFFVVKVNGEIYVHAYDDIDMDKFFYKVSKIIAFSDCADERILGIFYNGIEVNYAGWQPNMRYEYKDANGLTVWVGDFPEWDH